MQHFLELYKRTYSKATLFITLQRTYSKATGVAMFLPLLIHIISRFMT